MCAMAAHPPRLDSVLSFSHGPVADRPANALAFSDDDDDDSGFEFAFAPPLTAAGGDADDVLAPADDLFAHGRIIPAYPVFDRHLLLREDSHELTTAPPSPDTYCAWAPRSAPGSPARDGGPFPKSASTGEARRFWRLRDLVAGGGGRSHSDGKEKFVFLQPTASSADPSRMSRNKAPTMAAEGKPQQATKPSAPPQQKQSKKKSSKAAAATEMDMATAHKLFYGKQGAGALAGDRKQPQSYLPYRPGIVGFFATAHALSRSRHPY